MSLSLRKNVQKIVDGIWPGVYEVSKRLGSGSFNDIWSLRSPHEDWILRINNAFLGPDEAKERRLEVEFNKMMDEGKLEGTAVGTILAYGVRTARKLGRPAKKGGVAVEIMEKFDMDLDAYLRSSASNGNKATALMSAIRMMALMIKNELYCSDIKPPNFLVNVGRYPLKSTAAGAARAKARENETPIVRATDLGADWCAIKTMVPKDSNRFLNVMTLQLLIYSLGETLQQTEGKAQRRSLVEAVTAVVKLTKVCSKAGQKTIFNLIKRYHSKTLPEFWRENVLFMFEYYSGSGDRKQARDAGQPGRDLQFGIGVLWPPLKAKRQ